MGSSPVAFKYIFFSFFFRFASFIVFILDFVQPGYINLNLACVYVTNTCTAP